MKLDYAFLKDKTCIVTGGTQGLGEAVARFAAARGATGLTICGRNQARGIEVARELESTGCPTLYVRADLSQEADCRQVVREHDKRFGQLFGLANVAASTARGTLDNTTVEQWDQMFALNVRAPFVLMQESVRLMKKGRAGGSVVNISSISGHGGQSFLTAYCSSKGALDVLTKNAAHALRDHRIRVNSLRIGWMATPGEHAVQRADGNPPDWLDAADASSPFGRILRPEEVAKLVAFLWSDDAAMMTGSLIDYDYNVIGSRD
ncbi:MAG: SDR family oxidoreductase [Proteobacteria bacterium]|nr:SDR family oxidoreductase [Pseudomonadota bacterium]